jgi:hypothetical protein
MPVIALLSKLANWKISDALLSSLSVLSPLFYQDDQISFFPAPCWSVRKIVRDKRDKRGKSPRKPQEQQNARDGHAA